MSGSCCKAKAYTSILVCRYWQAAIAAASLSKKWTLSGMTRARISSGLSKPSLTLQAAAQNGSVQKAYVVCQYLPLGCTTQQYYCTKSEQKRKARGWRLGQKPQTECLNATNGPAPNMGGQPNKNSSRTRQDTVQMANQRRQTGRLHIVWELELNEKKVAAWQSATYAF